MDRKHFINLTALSSIGLLLDPLYALPSEESIPKNVLIGKGNPNLSGTDYRLQSEAYLAFQNMQREALKSDISIKIVSSYRSFNHQNNIWKRKFKKYTSNGMTAESAINKIIEYSTIPGTSRHHWGTDIDIIDTSVKQPKYLLAPNNFNSDGAFNALKQWMDKNAKAFGFYLVYTDQPDRKGFKYEPWHYSYKPLSSKYLRDYRKLNHQSLLKNENILGCEHFTNVFIDKYLNENILDINPELL